MVRACSLSLILFPRASALYKTSMRYMLNSHYCFLVNRLICFKILRFCSCMLAWGMVRACSLSLILFPRASALYKIVERIIKIVCYLSCEP
ncbi:hypothetical protein BU072_08220 [Mammaliicoccus vitulinus]|uniref:Uncharacterized protein n=1 Tax=Mammaliicoccus vitulinus TaxID=71237 RepID=A0A2T4PSN6_9STAP|nr:hypothetical protein BU072_08220 [Mammaliicoccus vitulinus]